MKRLEAAEQRAQVAAKEVATAVEETATEVATAAEGATAAVGEMGAAATAATAEATEAATAGAETTAAAAEKAEASSGIGVSSIGKLGIAAGVAGVAFAAFATKLGVDWQDAMTSLSSAANIPEESANRIGDALTGISDKTTFSAETIASSLTGVAGQWEQYTGKALDAKQSTDLMSVAAKEAQATHADLATTTQGLVGTLIAFHEPASAASNVMDELYNTSRATGSSVPDLASAMDKLEGRLGNVTPSLSDLSALTDEMAQHGISGSRGILTMSSALQSLLGGSKSVTTELGKLGVNLYDAQGHFIGMGPLIEQLQTKFKGLSDAQQNEALKTLFGASAGGIMANVIKDGTSTFDKYKESLGETGTVQEAYSRSQKDLGNQMAELHNQADNLVREFGTFLVGAILKVEDVAGPYISMVAGFIEKHKSLQRAIEVLGGALTAIVVLFGIYEAATLAATMATVVFGGALAVVTSPITLIIAAIALLVLGIYELITHWKQVSAAVEEAWHDVLNVVQSAVNTVLDFLRSHWQLIVAILTGPIGAAVLLIIDNWDKIKAATQAAWDAVKGILTTTWDAIKGVFTGTLSAITSSLTQAWDTAKSAIADTWGAIRDLFTSTWTAIQTTFTTIVSAIIAFLTTSWDTIKTAVTDTWSAISAFLSGTWSTIQSVITGTVNEIISFLSGAWGTISGAASSAWGAIESTISNILSTLYSDVTRIGGDIVDYFSGLPGEIVGAIGDLGSLLYSAGADLIHGLINGINSMIDKIPGGSFVSSALGKVGIHLAGGGPIAANQLAVVGENGPELFMPNTSGTVIPNSIFHTPSYARPGGGGAGVGGTVVNINGPIMALNPDDFVAQVSERMKSNIFTGVRLP